MHANLKIKIKILDEVIGIIRTIVMGVYEG